MQFMKRIFLFAVVNILIIVTLSIVMNLFGVQPYLNQAGLDYNALLGFALIWGFGGALISLALSRVMAKMMMGVKLVQPQSRDPHARALVERVYALARHAGLTTMPEVGIYNSPEINAFATGPTKSRSLVAVSSGLLEKMNDDEVEGVLAHEIAHIANGDMVTMTLVQGVVNAFVIFFARVIAWFIAQGVKEENRGAIQFVIVFMLEIILSLLGMMVVAAFSRAREFRADGGGAKLAGREKMRAALMGLKRHYGKMISHEEEDQPSGAQPALATLKISGKKNKFLYLLSTHPDLDERIARLR
ncbi:MAG: protease HtpX [Oligoflexia bacterium]|nr:protease HtpX [Oligoflexia bacterium]